MLFDQPNQIHTLIRPDIQFLIKSEKAIIPILLRYLLQSLQQPLAIGFHRSERTAFPRRDGHGP